MKKFVLMGILISMMVFGAGIAFAQEEAGESVATADYEDFSVGMRFGTWGLNTVIPGLGSYLFMQDGAGGTMQLVFGLTGGLFDIVAGVIFYLGGAGDGLWGTIAYGSLGIGIGCAVFTGVYNIIRSATYHRPLPKVAEKMFDPNAWSVALLPGRDGNFDQLQLAYNLKF